MKKNLLIFVLTFLSNSVMSQDAGIKKNSKNKNGTFYLAIGTVGVESGFRIHVGKNFFATGSVKGAFANYNHFLIDGGYGKHKWLSGQSTT